MFNTLSFCFPAAYHPSAIKSHAAKHIQMKLCNERSIITKFSDCDMLSWLYQSCTFTSCACDCQSWPAVESNVALDKRLAAIKDGSEGFLQVSSFFVLRHHN